MHAFKVALVLLAVTALCTAEAAKKSTKKSEKASSKLAKVEKESRPHKRGLYPDPHLGSTYAIDGAPPAEFYHGGPEEHLSVHHDLGLYGGVYAGHVDPHVPVVAATYAPRYTHGVVGGYSDHTSYAQYGHGYLGGFPGGLHGLEALLGGVKIEEGTIRIKTITTHVPVAVPHPVPVEVIKKVPVPVPHPVPVDVPRAVRVEVPQPYPVEVKKPYPVEVPKPVPHFVHVPVHVKVPQPYPVEVPTPYKVEVHRPVAVPVPHHIEVPVPTPVAHHDHEAYTAASIASHSTEHEAYGPAYSTHVPPVIKHVTSTYAPPVVAVTKCKEEYVDVTPAPVTFGKDVLAISAHKHGYESDYHNEPSYVTPAPSYVSITPAPAYVTASPSYSKPLVAYAEPYVKQAAYVTPAPYVKEASYVTPAPYVKEASYVTPAPYAKEASYVTSAPYAKEASYVTLSPYAKHVPAYVTPSAYFKDEPSYVPTTHYGKPVSTYVSPYHVAEHSYPKDSYGYAPVAYQPHGYGYGYGKGVATSFVGVTAHGNPSYAGYKSHVHHHTPY